jgi:hypothetical protein
MGEATTELFGRLGRRSHQPLLEKASGTLRFDLADGDRVERWHVSVKKGDVVVSRKNAAADCVVRTTADVFESIARGESNAMATVLRGAVAIEGNLDLLILFQRLFPGLPDTRDELPAAGYAGRRR